MIRLIVVQCIGWMLPPPLQRKWLNLMLGWSIGKKTSIGLSLFLVPDVRIGSGVRVRHFNLAKDVSKLVIGDSTVILSFNHFAGARYTGWPCTFLCGRSVVITSHHFFDCSGNVEIGSNTTIAGRGTQLWTHTLRGIGEGEPTLEWGECKIGPGSYVGARSMLIMASLPARSIVGAAAVVTKDYRDQPEGTRFLGNPARPK